MFQKVFRVQTAAAGQIFRNSIKIKLRDKAFQVPAALLENPGEVVPREELRRLWHEEVFAESTRSARFMR